MLKDAIAATTFSTFASLNNYSSILSISSPLEGDDIILLTASTIQRDFPSSSKTTFHQQLVFNSASSKLIKLSPVIPDSQIQVSSSKEGTLVSLKSTLDNKRFVLISNNSSIDVSKMHGPFYSDDYFNGPGIAWNQNASMVAYVAEELEPTDDEKFLFHDDAGEGYSGKRRPVLVLVDLTAKNVTVVKHASLFGCAQPVFAGNRLFFVGLVKEPLRLGIRYCTNRNTSLYSSKMDGSDLQRHGQEKRSVRYPKLNPDGKSLLYLSNPVGGPHESCATLIQFDIESGLEFVIVGEVESPESIHVFPGLFAQFLLNDCFVVSKDGVVLLLTSTWRSRTVILAVNLHSKQVTNLTPTGVESWVFQKTTQSGQVFALRSSPAQPPSLMTLDLHKGGDWLCIDKPALPSRELEDQLNSITFKIEQVPERSTNLEVIYLSSSAKIHSFASQTRPLIVIPHGGPHGNISTLWSFSVAAFLTLGFDVCCVNYTGSTGFGNSSIKALVGNIGSLDIDDVHAAAQWASSQNGVSKENIFLHGGSHGGFITGHLLTRENGFYNAGCIRNPVMNVGSMPYTSDIPDWCFSEAGLPFNPAFPLMPNPALYNEMYQASPVYYSDFPTSKTSPVLLHLGQNDRRVPHSQGLRWAEVLLSKGTDVQVLMFPGTGHALDSIDAERVGFESAVAFFIQHLKL